MTRYSSQVALDERHLSPDTGSRFARTPLQEGPAGPRGTSLSRTLATGPFGLYPGQQDRGVFQTISRMSAYGSTIVTTGTQVSDGAVRQQLFFSADGGRSWQLAPVRTVSGGQPSLGYRAARVADGPRGWATASWC